MSDDDWDPVNPDFSSKDVAAAIVPKVAAALSLIGSSTIIAEVLADKRNGGSSRALAATKHMLLAMSVGDLFLSFGWFLSTWPSPVDTPWAWGAKGNTATCEAQAVLLVFGWVTSPLFNISLVAFYLMIVKYGWTERKLQTLLPWIHGVIWGLGVVLSLSFLFADMYNSDSLTCWIEPYPFGCKESYKYGEDEATCTRGDNAGIFAIIFGSIFPGGICILLSCVIMGLIYATVRKIEQRQNRWPSSHGAVESEELAVESDNNNQQKSTNNSPATSAGARSNNRRVARTNDAKQKAVLSQARWYIGAFMFCFLPDLVAVILWSGFGFWSYWLDYIAYFCLPLQGFINFIVFSRKRSDMKTCFGKVLKQIICCFGKCRSKPLPSTRRTSFSVGSANVNRTNMPSISESNGASIKKRADKAAASGDGEDDDDDDDDGDDIY
jgi:hypothetical protein